ncbi:MAG: DNA alkylation repair protein [Flexilinea sp.]
MEKIIREQLFAAAEPEYQIFSKKLIPDTEHVFGVRLPALRKLAKESAKGDYREWLADPDCVYHEELLLQGLVIGYAPMDVQERLNYITAFIPKITNWAVCDSFCNSLKFTKNNKEQVWAFLQQYFFSANEFEIRFAVVMTLSFFVDYQYVNQALQLFDHIRHDGYYVKMAVAWAVAEYYIKLPDQTKPFLLENNLDDFTHNKSLQKITESYRISSEDKVFIRSLKRKKNKNGLAQSAEPFITI